MGPVPRAGESQAKAPRGVRAGVFPVACSTVRGLQTPRKKTFSLKLNDPWSGEVSSHVQSVREAHHFLRVLMLPILLEPWGCGSDLCLGMCTQVLAGVDFDRVHGRGSPG